jgi:hypothetical protein
LSENGIPAWAIPAMISMAAIILMGIVALVSRGSQRRRRRSAFTPAPRTAGPREAPEADPPEAAETDPPDIEPPEVQPPDAFASLTVTSGPDAGTVYPLGDGVTTIGRSGRRQNEVQLTDAAVSREQARIVHDPSADSFTFVNESETNPSQVDGVALDNVELEDGATIQLGTTILTFTRG